MKKPSPIFVSAALAGLWLAPARAALINRWSFNNAAGAAAAGAVINDPVSAANGIVVGNGATFTGSAVTLTGSTTGNQTPSAIAGYVDLPNGLISSKPDLTVEAWATVVSAKNWQRLFDFGRNNIAGMGSGAAAGEIKPDATAAPGTTASSDNLFLAATRGTTANTQKAVARLNGGAEQGVETGLTITNGTQYHFAMVVEDGIGSFGANGAQLRWYLNGALAGTKDIDFHLTAIEDVNNWLGRSQFSGDSQANISYNEFRLYNHALSPSEITASRTAGPNATFAAPVAVADTTTMHPLQKARIKVLANDSASSLPGTIAIVQSPQFGTAVPKADGTILYSHTAGNPSSDTFTYRVNGNGNTSNTAMVTVNFSGNLRLSNTTLNVPSSPPATEIQLGAAFPSLATFSQPVCLATPPNETKRLFVCEKTGVIRQIPDVTVASPTQSSFLNLAGLLTSRGETLSTSSEQGLLGLAFHPNYATNRYFYIFYSVVKSGASSVYERVSRFTTQAGNPNAADIGTEQILIEQLDPASNHNGGDLHFGADGYLYISIGDGGGQNDQYNNSQRINLDFFSSILRIDVDKKPGNLVPNSHPSIPDVTRYSVPLDNPFVHTSFGGTWNGTFNGSNIPGLSAVRTEIYATGFRNPWRFSFDATTGDLWCGDVGQGAYEEIDIVTKGGNYGWAYREANHNGSKSGSAPANFDTLYHKLPIHEYNHGSGSSQGDSVTGGLVYRGTRFASLTGKYIFADYVSGNVWALTRNGQTSSVARIAGQGGIAAFGTDPSNGDVLLANVSTGSIQRLTVGTVTGSYPATLSATGVFADLADLSPNPGLLPYSPNLTFWSDFAAKRRWFVIPDAASKMTWSRDGAWTYPNGMIWVKHFDMELTRTNPPAADAGGPRKRIETRLLVKNSGGVYGVSYRWNEAGTEATLVADGGEDLDINVTQNGAPYTQRWHIPSRADCITCHNQQAGGALSFNTRQLNLSRSINGFSGNQIDLFRDAGYFSNSTESTAILPRHVRPDEASFPLESRARSYLAVNCAYCHLPGGSGASWDGRAHIPLDQTGMINGSANGALNPADKLIVPNDVSHSTIYNRAAAANGYTRMPPLATNELDQVGNTLLGQWIQGYPAARKNYAAWRLEKFASNISPAGAAEADPDGDGLTNRFEYLKGSQPLVADASSQSPSLSLSGNFLATFAYSLSPNAIGQVQTSSDLSNWSPWNVPGNDGIARDGLQSIQGLGNANRQFFRLHLYER